MDNQLPKTAKPAPALPTLDQVPEELRLLKRWVGWRATWDEFKKKWKKPPCSAVTGEEKGWPESGVTFAEALHGAQALGLSGVGFIFNGEEYFGVDFDDCVTDGVIHSEVRNLLQFLPTYQEISPSGSGVHAICRGKLPNNKAVTAKPLPNADGVTLEAYDHARYFCWTGRRIGTEDKVTDCQLGFEKVLSFLNVKSDAKEEADAPRPMSRFTARKIHQDNLKELLHAPKGAGNATLNTTAFFAGRAFAAGVLDGTDEEIRQQLLDIVTKEWKFPHEEKGARDTIASGWGKGILKPLVIDDNRPVFGSARRAYLEDHARRWWKAEADVYELVECDAMSGEMIFYMELNKANDPRRVAPPLPSSTLRALSVELFEELSGKKVPVYPGMLEDDVQPNSDVGFGKHFARCFGDFVRYNAETTDWLVYSKGVWRVDDDRVQVRKYLKEFFLTQAVETSRTLATLDEEFQPISGWFFKDGQLKQEHEEEITPEQRELARLWFELQAKLKLARDGQSVKRLANALESAETEGLSRGSSGWDGNTLLLNLRNATIDLTTGEMLTDRRNAFCTMQGGVNFEGDASCPAFEKVLARSLPDAAIREFLQDSFGLSLSGLMTPEILIFLGEGANGKGLLLRIMAGILADYYHKAAMTSFLATKNVSPGGARSDLSGLRGKRLITAAEANRKVTLDMELLKDWTGGEDFSARDLWEKAKKGQYRPQGKLVLSMNHPPRIDDQTHATWRRLRYVNFNVIIPAEERNEHLADELLRTEGPGILNWLLTGWARVRERLEAGKPALVAPASVLAATDEYKESESQVARFFADEIILKKDGKLRSSDLYARYKGWCNRTGEFPIRDQRLTLELKRHCHDKNLPVDLAGHNHHTGWHWGIELRASGLESPVNDELPFEPPGNGEFF